MIPDERRSAGRSRPGVLVPVTEPGSAVPLEYGALLAEFKGRIGQARLRITLAANSGMLLLYWELGRLILARQSQEGWGAKVIDRLSSDLRTAFPEMKGLSPRNLKYMRAFADAWPDRSIVQGTLAQLPWYHHVTLLDKLDHAEERLWYAARSLEHGWSQSVLFLQIQANAHLRVGQAQNNFQQTLPPEKSDLAVQDDVLRQPDDQPTIGLLLVSEKNRVLAEYCLSGNKRPVGIAEWTNRLTRSLPEKFRGSLPTIEEIEGELSGVEDESVDAARAARGWKRGGR